MTTATRRDANGQGGGRARARARAVSLRGGNARRAGRTRVYLISGVVRGGKKEDGRETIIIN